MGDITGDGSAVSGLGGPKGYGETALARGDEGYAQVDVSAVFEDGFVIDGVTYDGDALFISTDGFVTFGSGVASLPSNPANLNVPFIAPFMADIDTRLDGEGSESGQVWMDVDTANDCVTITWDDVGFYRRNASLTNTFQLQLFDRGDGAMDVVFRYDSIEWTAGDLQGGWGGLGGTPAMMGYRMDTSGAVTYFGPSGDEAGLLDLPTSLGNTGVPGLFVYRLGGAQVPIKGGTASDTIFGTAGDDTLQALGGDDLMMGSLGADEMNGGKGLDTVDFLGAPQAVKVDFAHANTNSGWAEGDSFVAVENLRGTLFADTLMGGSEANWFDGAAGDDSLNGRGGADTLDGNDGHDTLIAVAGDDVINGGKGDDSVKGGKGDDVLSGALGDDTLRADAGNDSAEGGDGSDTLFGAAGNDTLSGGAGNDVVQGQTGSDDLNGGAGDDSLKGGNDNDTVQGGTEADGGADTLRGGAGNDLLYGGVADDFIYGDAGNDLLAGGAGDDVLTGGAGADLFQHMGITSEGRDTVTDYDAGEGDVLLFGINGANASRFTVTYQNISGGGVLDAVISYDPTGQVIWVVEDARNLTEIIVQSNSLRFDLV